MNKVQKVLVLVALVGASALAAHAQTAVDYGAVITTNFGLIDTLWGKVAVIMIAVALVTVSLRFFRKTK